MFAFYASKHFQSGGGLDPVPGARDALLRLRDAGCELHVVTSRQKAIRETTLEWLNLHYKDIFTSVQFGVRSLSAGGGAVPVTDAQPTHRSSESFREGVACHP